MAHPNWLDGLAEDYPDRPGRDPVQDDIDALPNYRGCMCGRDVIDWAGKRYESDGVTIHVCTRVHWLTAQLRAAEKAETKQQPKAAGKAKATPRFTGGRAV